MLILGLDPGATTGWCAYDTATSSVVRCGHFAGSDVPYGLIGMSFDATVIERPKGYGATYPQVVDAAWHAGILWQQFGRCHTLERREVRAILTDATLGTVRVKNDASAWAALVLLHGDGSDKRAKTRKGEIVEAGGPLGGVTSHARAALAVAYAWWLQSAKGKP